MTGPMIAAVILLMIFAVFAAIGERQRIIEEREERAERDLAGLRGLADRYWENTSTSGSTHRLGEIIGTTVNTLDIRAEKIFAAPYLDDLIADTSRMLERTAHKCKYCGTKSLVSERNCISCGAPL